MYSLRSPRARLIAGLMVAFFLAWVFTPYYFLVTVSLVPQGTIVRGFQVPEFTTFGNYEQVLFGSSPIWPFLVNSTVVSLGTTVVALLLALPAGYALSRLRTFVMARYVYLSFFVLRMLPPVALVIPYFLIFSRLGLLDRREGLIIALVPLTLPFTVWTVKVFFDVVPQSIEEAAQLDGASTFQTFLFIVLPMIAQGIAATAILTFLIAYVDYMIPATLARMNAMPLSVYVVSFQNDYRVYVGTMMAATLVGTLPMIVLYLYAQRYMQRMALIGIH